MTLCEYILQTNEGTKRRGEKKIFAYSVENGIVLAPPFLSLES